MVSGPTFSTSSSMVPPHVEKNMPASERSSKFEDPAKSDPGVEQTKKAALNVANYIESLYGKSDAGWREDVLRTLANGGTYHSNSLGKDISAPDDVKDAIKTLLAAGGASKFDLHKDGFVQADELRNYATFEQGSSDTKGDIK